MSEVIRLIRLTLVLRVAVAIAGALVALTLFPATSPLMLDMVVVVPSVVLLAITLLAPLRGWNSERFVKGLLVAVILAQALEALFNRIGYQWFAAVTGFEMGELLRRSAGNPSESLIIRLPLNVPLLFITIPALLGAWITGKNGAIRWAGFAVLMSLLSSLTFTPPEFTQLRLNAGLFGAQGIVVFITCYFVGSLADQQRAEQAQLEAANRKLAEQALVREQLAASRERVRLARDLHDTLAHTLAGLVIQLNVVDTLFEKDASGARRELVRAQSVAKHGLDETRGAISDLRANMIEDLGLSGALRRLTEMMGQRSGLQASFERAGDEPQLDKNCAETLFRISQEALNNVERHAEATHVNVTLRRENIPDPTLSISIKDNGVGFDVSALDDERFGLRGMRERAELIGAHLRVDSAAGAGTNVTVTLKLS
jgi:signal transduction histidine kinase